jgi:hypothetical protein
MTSVVTLFDLVWSRLESAPSAYAVDGSMFVYPGEVPATGPMDDDGRISSYACLYMFPGRQMHTDLTGAQNSLASVFQITCVGGDERRVLATVDAVRVTVPGAVTVGGLSRVIRANENLAQVPIRTDSGVWPPRHYVALDFDLFAP